jgi:hypothetical protein
MTATKVEHVAVEKITMTLFTNAAPRRLKKFDLSLLRVQDQDSICANEPKKAR